VTLGERIQALRDVRGIGRLELAKMAGLSRSGLGMIERGQRTPRLGALERIATALGVTPSDLLRSGAARRKGP